MVLDIAGLHDFMFLLNNQSAISVSYDLMMRRNLLKIIDIYIVYGSLMIKSD